jgi:hypothetical protein
MAIAKRKNARGEESSDSIASLSSQAEVEDLKDSLQEEIAEVKAKVRSQVQIVRSGLRNV